MIYGGVNWYGGQIGNIMCFNLNKDFEGKSRLKIGVHETGHFIYNTCLNESMKKENEELFIKYRNNNEKYNLPNSIFKKQEFFARRYADYHFQSWQMPAELIKFQDEIAEACP